MSLWVLKDNFWFQIKVDIFHCTELGKIFPTIKLQFHFSSCSGWKVRHLYQGCSLYGMDREGHSKEWRNECLWLCSWKQLLCRQRSRLSKRWANIVNQDSEICKCLVADSSLDMVLLTGGSSEKSDPLSSTQLLNVDGTVEECRPASLPEPRQNHVTFVTRDDPPQLTTCGGTSSWTGCKSKARRPRTSNLVFGLP